MSKDNDIIRRLTEGEQQPPLQANIRADIKCRQVQDGPNPPGLIKEMADKLSQLFPTAIEAGGKYVRGRGEQEVAKAAEIKAEIMKKIADVELERQRLINERDTALAKENIEKDKINKQHEQQMLKLKTEAFTEVVKAVGVFKDLDVKIKPEIVQAAKDLLAFEEIANRIGDVAREELGR